jgi:hypothetical protein
MRRSALIVLILLFSVSRPASAHGSSAGDFVPPTVGAAGISFPRETRTWGRYSAGRAAIGKPIFKDNAAVAAAMAKRDLGPHPLNFSTPEPPPRPAGPQIAMPARLQMMPPGAMRHPGAYAALRMFSIPENYLAAVAQLRASREETERNKIILGGRDLRELQAADKRGQREK